MSNNSKFGNGPLLPDDIKLFRTQMADAIPLKQDHIEPFRKHPAPRPRPRIIESQDAIMDSPISEAEVITSDFLEFSRPGVQKRLLHALRKGQIPPQLDLDLHGLTVTYAQENLDIFLKECQRRALKCVRIIHGKGIRSEGQQPILKCKVNYWLRCYNNVLAFSSAPRWDGGSGAAYVLLRNSRKK